LLQQVSFSCQAGNAGFSVDSGTGRSCSVKLGVRLGGLNYPFMGALVVVLVGDCRGKIVDSRSILGKEAVQRLRSIGELAGTFGRQNSVLCLSLHHAADPSQRSRRTVCDKFLSGQAIGEEMVRRLLVWTRLELTYGEPALRRNLNLVLF
jgi:hypothetical protein